jgi:hypothetical protein
MRTIIIGTLLISISFLIQSQDIKIIMVDSLTNKPISYASAYFKNNKTGTYTNENGVFYYDKSDHIIQVSHIGYYTRIIKLPIKNDTVKMQPHSYILNEITVMPSKQKVEIKGYYSFRSFFTISGFSGDELAVYLPNNADENKLIKEIIIGFSTKKYIKNSLGIDFISIFRINLYSKKENSKEPDSLLIKNDLVFTSDILRPETIINVSKYNLPMPKDGIFVSIEWIGIESKNTKKLITDYKNLTEPFVTTTFEKTQAVVYERNKFKETNWKLIDKNNKFSSALKKDNFYTPRISLSLY